MTGIYEIVHLASGRRYIGQSIDVKRRLGGHRTALRKGTHHCGHLQRAWLKHGEPAFAFRLIEICTMTEMTQREQFWMDAAFADGLYNATPAASSCIGVRRSEETRQRISAAMKGRKCPWNAVVHKGNTWGHANRGKPQPWVAERNRANVRSGSEASFFGRHHTEEAKAKIGAANRGRRNPAVTDAWAGRKHSAESRAKMSASHRGKPHPWTTAAMKGRILGPMKEATKRKLSESKSSLSEADKAEIRRLLAGDVFLFRGGKTMLAKIYGVSPPVITRALRPRKKHLS